MNSLISFVKKIRSKLVKIIADFTSTNFGFDTITGTKIQCISTLEHLGTSYGGWFIPKDCLNSESICYCVGAGEDVSFDISIVATYGSKVFIFDPTPRAIENFNEIKRRAENGKNMPINNNSKELYNLNGLSLENLKFFEFGIWDKEETIKFYTPKDPKHVSHSILNLQKTDKFFEAEVKPLSSIMQSLNHSKIDLLKLNVEGAEYNIIKSIIENHLNIQILCIVFDELNHILNKDIVSRIKRSLEELNKFGFVVVKKSKAAYTLINRKSKNYQHDL